MDQYEKQFLRKITADYKRHVRQADGVTAIFNTLTHGAIPRFAILYLSQFQHPLEIIIDMYDPAYGLDDTLFQICYQQLADGRYARDEPTDAPEEIPSHGQVMAC